ncbi:MAG: DUF484 family protein [Rhodospirillales bacterium]|jgi:hypothetical protein|nr:DUF484 family protein [Rhodospirillales bacterium]MBT4007380.1 DUF484 family protein [Rhodospirillales bacterium]MBT5075248.1 DUF484 family protein [Rhodospirillales bacterium]MBT5112407.1 DUF484 family protein [Rhodospirillales bacterium]MBT5673195.1 DUF484 family protein [Rhodospirillales bacterium]
MDKSTTNPSEISDKPDPKKAETPQQQATPSYGDIKAFLGANPGYLAKHPKILDAIAPERRHIDDDNIADFQSILIDRLRAENDQLASEHATLIATSRANMTTQSRIHAGALALLEARSFNDLIQAITTDLAVKLDVDVVRLMVEDENGVGGNSISGIHMVMPGDIDALMQDDRDIVLRQNIEGEKSIYGSASGLVRSEALLRLHASPDSPTGMLAIGSRHKDRFDPGQGTELLGFLARTLELCIRTWLGLPRK